MPCLKQKRVDERNETMFLEKLSLITNIAEVRNKTTTNVYYTLVSQHDDVDWPLHVAHFNFLQWSGVGREY